MNLRDPNTLSRAQLAEVIAAIQRILWRDGPDTEWTPETPSEIATVLQHADLAPTADDPDSARR
jgi:hypothetical protein